jgi:hypothetical protein
VRLAGRGVARILVGMLVFAWWPRGCVISGRGCQGGQARSIDLVSVTTASMLLASFVAASIDQIEVSGEAFVPICLNAHGGSPSGLSHSTRRCQNSAILAYCACCVCACCVRDRRIYGANIRIVPGRPARPCKTPQFAPRAGAVLLGKEKTRRRDRRASQYCGLRRLSSVAIEASFGG